MSLRYDIEFYSASPYNVLTGTAMPIKMKKIKFCNYYRILMVFINPVKPSLNIFLNKTIENMDSDNNSNANAHYVNYRISFLEK